jgi:hypothetical protein
MAWTAAFILIVVLFNPILPIRLHRSIWFYLDLMAVLAFSRHIWSFAARDGEMSKRKAMGSIPRPSGSDSTKGMA